MGVVGRRRRTNKNKLLLQEVSIHCGDQIGRLAAILSGRSFLFSLTLHESRGTIWKQKLSEVELMSRQTILAFWWPTEREEAADYHQMSYFSITNTYWTLKKPCTLKKKKKRFCKLPQRSGPQQAGSQGGGEEEDYSDVILLALPPVLISLHHVKASPHLLRTSRASPVNTPFFPNSLSSQFCLFFQHGRWSLEEHEFRSHR